jgi:formylglycine-generating enzyme required for sulfatase activity
MIMKIFPHFALAAALASFACTPEGELTATMDPDMVPLRQGTVTFRPAGEYLQAGRPVDAPVTKARIGRGLSIMRHHVTVAEYRRCVAERACSAVPGDAGAGENHPAVNVSWRDARAYAAWLSTKTGQHYRLPTDAEWAYAAGSRYRDEVFDAGTDASQRWIARYDREANVDQVDKATKSVGSFGANENGLFDFAQCLGVDRQLLQSRLA